MKAELNDIIVESIDMDVNPGWAEVSGMSVGKDSKDANETFEAIAETVLDHFEEWIASLVGTRPFFDKEKEIIGTYIRGFLHDLKEDR